MMNKNKVHNLFCLWALILTLVACTEENTVIHPNDGKEKCVTLSFSVGNADISRAPEAGWSTWNENKIEKVNMFIFHEDGTCVPFSGSATDLQGSSDTGDYTWQPAELTRDNIQVGDEIYVIANCNASELESVNSIDDLKKLSITGLQTPGKQDAFLMDGYKKIADGDLNGNQIAIDLKRAAAKIRLTFNSNSQADWKNTIGYSFRQYATKSTVLDLGEGSYLEDPSLATYPEDDGKGNVHTVTAADLYTDNNDKTYLVLYSYANDWFDDQKDVHEEEPINNEKQTYIMLKAPYEGKEYYYKIPVNYRLPDFNDDIEIDPEKYKHLYRLQRNYIYDITVTIDHVGGTYLNPEEIANFTIDANPWEREDFEVKYEDNLSYMSNGWDENTILGYLDSDETIVHIDPDQPAVLHFTIQTPSYATWRAQLVGEDLNYFEFVDEHSGDASPASQTISIQCKEPDSDDRHSVTLYVYASIFGQEYELDLTNPQQSLTPNTSGEIRRFTILQAK
ncbi:MAG: DUF4906 domain-containing protein [Candidatus Phocaeicola faecipullorum]|nr:DUF4906 domain-containing protein [Candidatus Phocaeicola faecipullorum]